MPFKFFDLCTLLSDLESYYVRDVPLLPNILRQKTQERTRQWFRSHKITISSPEVDVVALLSALFPEKRTDRVFSLKAPSLSRRLRRCLCLGVGRWPLLEQWKTPGGGDLGDCVERALKQSEFPKQLPENEVTLEQVDAALGKLAARNRFSGPDVRGSKENEDPKEVDRVLERMYRRMQSREAKWFTRILIKDLAPLKLPLPMVLGCIHPDLPQYIKVYDTFEAAVSMLRGRGVPSTLPEGQRDSKPVGILTPKVGVKLGRSRYTVARSVKHAVGMISHQRMSVERKYDGEYCQIHIDLTAEENWIKIFSKSGKDSTVDRTGVHEAIKNSLRVGRKECGFSRKCILEGELVVWSDREKDILDFCKIRKHVSRSGSFLGTTFDSQPHDFEHLMIIYYDVMLMDNDPIIDKSHTRRRRLLKKLITPIPGRAALAVRDLIDFSSANGPNHLQQALARAFAMRWEGLVLKPSNEPYYSTRQLSSGEYPSCWIKMKKDYIKGLGDTADFAVVGAGYDVAEARKFGSLKLKWTHFHLGCLTNKDEVVRRGAQPRFAVIDALNLCIKPEDITTLNQLGQFRAIEMGCRADAAAHGMILEQGVPDMVVAFKEPFVFEVMGAGFDKKANRTNFSLRFSRVLKIHWDRDWMEAVTTEELKEMVSASKLVPSDDLVKDVAQWMEHLKKVDRGVKGVLAPWENSQDNEVEEEATTVQTARYARRSRSKSEAPPMIRMDTREMNQSEYRLENGGVLRRHISKQSEISFAVESPLPTPPTSSPFRAALDNVGNKHSSASLTKGSVEDSRKRKVAETDSEEVTSSDEATQFKRARRFFRAQSRLGGPSSGSSPHPIAMSKALQSITNPARLRETPPIKPARRRNGRSTTPESFLVRKIPVGVSEAAYRQSNLGFQSSPARETTASEYTSHGTSQQTITPGAYARPPSSPIKNPTPTPSSNNPQPSGMYVTISPTTGKAIPRSYNSADPTSSPIHPNTPDPTPPSPAPHPPVPPKATPTVTTPMEIQPPNLHAAQIFLSPCIATTPYVTEDLLASQNLAFQPFPQTSSMLLAPPSTSPPPGTSTKHKPVILLIESRRKDPTVAVLKSLARQLQRWPAGGGRSVDIWDWRVLEVLKRGGDGGGREEVREWFFARMSWDNETQEVEVVWRDGEVTRGELPEEGEGEG